jgi:hypothetical protein
VVQHLIPISRRKTQKTAGFFNGRCFDPFRAPTGRVN